MLHITGWEWCYLHSHTRAIILFQWAGYVARIQSDLFTRPLACTNIPLPLYFLLYILLLNYYPLSSLQLLLSTLYTTLLYTFISTSTILYFHFIYPHSIFTYAPVCSRRSICIATISLYQLIYRTFPSLLIIQTHFLPFVKPGLTPITNFILLSHYLLIHL